MTKKKYTLLALTMGDPAGIGPEIAIKALSSTSLPQRCRVFIIGDSTVLEQAAQFSSTTLPLHTMQSVDDLAENSINVFPLHQIKPADFTVGKVNAHCGKAAYAYIVKAIELARAGRIDGVVTNPISKSALQKAGINFPGHTEIFAHMTNTLNCSMMFLLDSVGVVHVTTHCSLREAIEQINHKRVYRNILLLNTALQSLGFTQPRIAVGGLNPHAGENGLFGTEEQEHIIPAINQAMAEGIAVSGPYPPDTVFMRAFRGEFNGIVSMLHDHGFVALKSRDFDHGVNITIGLPIIRTSVGHGTAFDIAGTGKASEKSLLAAINAAYALSKAISSKS